MEITRHKELGLLSQLLKTTPAVAIVGPRQCGKTTLAQQFVRLAKVPVHSFDLEDPNHLAQLQDPMLALQDLKGFVILDEIQRRPELFPVLRVLIDRHPKIKFLILGSASRDLLFQSSETLAGRISYLELGGFPLNLLKATEMKKLWLRGGFPRSFLAKSPATSLEWRRQFISSYLERDIPNLGFGAAPATLRRFWQMLAHYHGQIFNASEISHSLGVADTTARHYLDILSSTFMVRQLKPWHYNTKKRLVKRPKLFFRDSGIFHALMAIGDEDQLRNHPKLGASWEGFALEQLISHLNLAEDEAYFWAVHGVGEIDLVFQRKGRLFGAKVKYGDHPTLNHSMTLAQKELNLKHLWVLHPGSETYRLATWADAVPLSQLTEIKI